LRAFIVVDLGFGDGGKGLLTDFLVRNHDTSLVVRYNGGAQAGHNVVTPDGRHHTFSQFGSGTFLPHVRSYLSRHVVVHPTALLVEGDILVDKGVEDPFSRLRISDQAVVITPYHQAANRIREIIRGSDRHGSCGVGVGEAYEDALTHHDDCVVAGDLYHPMILRQKLQATRERKRKQLAELLKSITPGIIPSKEWEVFKRDEVIDTWITAISRIRELDLVTSDTLLESWLSEMENVVFEGAQGILLDGDVGFHPFTTWSRCTSANALEIINEMIPGADVFQIGVMRSYAFRHGPGPLPTESDTLADKITEHNGFNLWQGPARYGWFDAVLARYALEVAGGVDALAITHMDLLGKLDAWSFSPGYAKYHDLARTASKIELSGSSLLNFSHPNDSSLSIRIKLTQGLFRVIPEFESCEAEEGMVLNKIEKMLGRSVGIISRGPCSTDVEILNTIPS